LDRLFFENTRRSASLGSGSSPSVKRIMQERQVPLPPQEADRGTAARRALSSKVSPSNESFNFRRDQYS
jgi:hypothetical protein